MKILYLVLFLTVLTISCNSQGKKTPITKVENLENEPAQIGQYVVDVFQDSKENLWFGTLEKGVAKFDGEKLRYFTTKDGLPSNRITNVIEDEFGNIWLGTGVGISKFDGNTFTNYSEKDGLCSDMVSSLFIDSKGNLWIGTWGGVCTFNGKEFHDFPVPYPKVSTQINPDTKDWTTSISEDAKGNIWIGRDGYGIARYDGNSFVYFTKKDGLNSNYIQSIHEDEQGNVWVSTRVAERDNADPNKRSGEGGLNMFDGEQFIHFTNKEGLYKSDVYTIYEDNSKDLWITTASHGVYKYTNNEFLHYDIPKSIVAVLDDNKGTIWLGCAGGLYKIDAKGEIINVTTTGPWE